MIDTNIWYSNNTLDRPEDQTIVICYVNETYELGYYNAETDSIHDMVTDEIKYPISDVDNWMIFDAV